MPAPARISAGALTSWNTGDLMGLDPGGLMPFQSSLVRYRTDELMHA